MACGGESYFCRSSSQFPAQPQARRRRASNSVLGIKFRRWRFETLTSEAYPESIRKRTEVIQVPKAESSESSAKKANLFAKRKETLMLPSHDNGRGRMYDISEFLSHPSGIEAILNTKALQSYQSLDSNTYRLTVYPDLSSLDLNKTFRGHIEKFEGSEAVERQNDHFSASMRNYITWNANGSEACLDTDVELNVTLEVYTPPFTFLPISAVEIPGNIIMQGLLDRLVPLLLQQLVQDYNMWVQQQCAFL